MNTSELKKLSIERKTRIREFVYGSQDGIISTLGLLAGVQTALQDRKITIIAGITEMIIGGLSMASASYLSSKSKKELLEKELNEQEKILEQNPDLAEAKLIEAFNATGLDQESSSHIVKIIKKKKDLFLQTFHEKVLGLGTVEFDKPFQAARVMFLSFISGSLIPFLPYLIFTKFYSFQLSILASALALFSIGLLKGHMVSKSKVLSGMEFVLIALGSAGIGWLIGKLFEHTSGIKLPI